MILDSSLLDKVRTLPPEKQQAVADFIEFLIGQAGKTGRKSRLKGMCSDLDVHITAGEIDALRHEAWGEFPREDV